MKVLSAAQDTLRFQKRKCQDWFAEIMRKLMLETKRNLFRKTLSTNLFIQAKMEATKTYKDFQKVAQTRMREIQKPVVAQEGKRSTTCSKQQKLEIVLPNNQRALWTAAINFAPFKSKDGATLRRPEDIKKRWLEH